MVAFSLLDFRPEDITFVEIECSPASCPNVANQFLLPVSMAVKHFIDACFLYRSYLSWPCAMEFGLNELFAEVYCASDY